MVMCQPLTGVSQHKAWVQQVQKEQQEQTKYGTQMHSFYRGEDDEHLQTKRNKWRQSENYSTNKLTNFAPHLRVNQTKLNLKRSNGYMSDGTALNMSDPNSMRDQGMTRNAQYVVQVKTGVASDSKHFASSIIDRTTAPYKRFLAEDQDKRLLNKTFYSFGGKQSFERAQTLSKNHPYMGHHFRQTVEDQRRQQTNFGRETMPTLKRSDIFIPQFGYEGQNVVVKHNQERVNDYTKNISQGIFSPGLLTVQASVQKQVRPRTSHPIKIAKSSEIVKKLAYNLNKEKMRKQRLAQEIRAIRAHLSEIQNKLQ